MSTSLRVLTYNVQMRSWAMEVGAQGSLTPYTSVEERAKTIAKRILGSPQQYDVVCLQEVFDEDGRAILADALGDAYPHRIEKSDADGLAVVSEAAFGVAAISATIPGGAALRDDRQRCRRADRGAFSTFEDSGLMLFSKLPFDELVVPQDFHDAAAANGVTLPLRSRSPHSRSTRRHPAATPSPPRASFTSGLKREGGVLHMLTSHTQADSTDGVEAHKGTRRAQLEQAYDLLAKMGVNVHEAEVLFCGDLNVDGMKHPAGYRQEWTELFDTPGSHYTDDLLDAWTREQCPGDPGPGMHRCCAISIAE